MRSFQRVVLGAFAVAALAVPAGASAQLGFVEKQAPENSPVVGDYKFINAGQNVVNFGVYLGPYTAQMLSYPGQPLITVYCVDFLHDVTFGQQWTANLSQVSLADIGDTRLGIAGDDNAALAKYKKAAWLAAQFATNQSATAWSQIHAAIWTTVLAGNDPTQPYYNQYGNWLNLAAQAEAGGYQGFNFSEWALLTDVKADDLGYGIAGSRQPGTQEFLVHVTVTPEPETLVLMLTGILSLGLVFWRRGGFA